jgi:hypothetical protein
MMEPVIVVPVRGDVVAREVEESILLDFMHRECEGYVDVVRCANDVIGECSVWVNDTGLLTGMEPNPRIMALLSTMGRLGQPIVGNAVITGPPNRETGDDIPLSTEQVKMLVDFFTMYDEQHQREESHERSE